MRQLGLHLLIVLIAGILLCACDRAPSRGSTAAPPQTRTIVEVRSITQLPPSRTVHVALDGLGNVYYTVETEKGQDGVTVVTESSIPRATQLTSANILAAMGESYGGSGAIQDLVRTADGNICFYFVGGKGRAIRACIGLYTPRTEAIQVLFDTKALMESTGLGDSIALARGRMMPSGGSRMHLFLRHLDAWRMMSFEISRAADPAQMSPAFERLLEDGRPLDLRREQYQFSPGIGQSLLLFDRDTGGLYDVDPKEAKMKLRAFLAGLPRELSAPLPMAAAAGKPDRLLIFAAQSEPIEAEVDPILLRRLPRTTYPALLELTGEQFTAIGGADLRILASGIPDYALRIRELQPAPDGSFVGYDLGSGQIVRLKIVQAPIEDRR